MAADQSGWSRKRWSADDLLAAADENRHADRPRNVRYGLPRVDAPFVRRIAPRYIVHHLIARRISKLSRRQQILVDTLSTEVALGSLGLIVSGMAWFQVGPLGGVGTDAPIWIGFGVFAFFGLRFIRQIYRYFTTPD